MYDFSSKMIWARPRTPSTAHLIYVWKDKEQPNFTHNTAMYNRNYRIVRIAIQDPGYFKIISYTNHRH